VGARTYLQTMIRAVLCATAIVSVAVGQTADEPEALLDEGFITSVMVAKDGSIWAGDEERALWRMTRDDLGRFHTERFVGPADEAGRLRDHIGLKDAYIYALAEDAHGRIWIGTGRNGLAIYDPGALAADKQWHLITPEHGLGGWHVYAMHAASDGSMWVATEVGLSHIRTDGTIKTLLTMDGLPSNQLCNIVEDQFGRIWVAGYLGGIARIQTVPTGPDHAPRYRIRAIPPSQMPGDELHDLYIDSDGKIWVAGNGGVTVFDRKTMRPLIALVHKDSKLPKRANVHKILPDRRITAVTKHSPGKMLLGTWRQGLWLLDTQTTTLSKVESVKADYIYRLVRARNGEVLVGTYGNGLWRLPEPPSQDKTIVPKDAPLKIELNKIKPSDQEPASDRLFREQLAAIDKTPLPRDGGNYPVGGAALYLGEDWVTRGDWKGHYGQFYYVLCAMNAPFDFYGGTANANYTAYIGDNRKLFVPRKNEDGWKTFLESKDIRSVPASDKPVDDSLRHWIHWLQTSNPKVLQIPTTRGTGRRHAEWDDHAEAYPRDWRGPHLYMDLVVNEGQEPRDNLYVLTMYFMNKDGHHGSNRHRDYRITIKHAVEPWGSAKPGGWEKRFEHMPTLAEARVHDFRGGVYYRFLMREGRYTVQLHKSGSFNTTMAGFFLDKVQGSGQRRPSSHIDADPAHHHEGIR